MNKKILIYPFISISLLTSNLFASNIDSHLQNTQQQTNKKLEQLLQDLKKIQALENQKTKNKVLIKKKTKPKISEKQQLQNKMDLLRMKVMYLSSLQEYNLQKENNNKSKVVMLLKKINNANILNYKKTTFKLPFENKITLNNSIEYVIQKKDLDTILAKIKTLKLKISKLQTENKVLPLLTLNQLKTIEQNKISTFQTNMQGMGGVGTPMGSIPNVSNIDNQGNPNLNAALNNIGNFSTYYLKLSTLPFRQIKIVDHTIILKNFY